MGAGGRREGAGRKLGSVGKRTREIMEQLEALGCDPIKGMVDIASEARKVGDLQLAGNMYKELACYTAPKLKSIEIQAEANAELKMSWMTPNKS